jgi:hypothetical protein
VYVLAVWEIRVPPECIFVLWLLSKDMLLTRDNVGKRRLVEDKTCLLCSEDETVNDLFFDCMVVRQAWETISEVVGFPISLDYVFVARCCLCNKKYGVVNMLPSKVCRSLWKVRNLICVVSLQEKHKLSSARIIFVGSRKN